MFFVRGQLPQVSRTPGAPGGPTRRRGALAQPQAPGLMLEGASMKAGQAGRMCDVFLMALMSM